MRLRAGEKVVVVTGGGRVGANVDVLIVVPVRKAVNAAFINGYLPSLHTLPVKSSRSGAQNMIPARPMSFAYFAYTRLNE